MYGFSGYGTNAYGSKRTSFKAIIAIVGTRTVVAFANFTRTVVALAQSAIAQLTAE